MGQVRDDSGNARAESSISVLDLFAGAGGLTEGFNQASSRFRTVRAVESDPSAAATFASNHDGLVFAGQIQRWLKEDVVPDVDVVVGGPPCQGFSTLGKQDEEDDRNTLWKHYAEVVKLAKPKYFVVENVAAFMKSPQLAAFRRRTDGRGGLRDYSFEARILNSADFGAPQVRRRAVLIGHHRDLASPGFPEITHPRADGWSTVKDALGGLAERVVETDLPISTTTFEGKIFPGVFHGYELHLSRHYEPRSLERFRSIPRLGNRFDIPDHLLSPCWRRHTSGSGDVMGRLDWDRPSVTIRTEFFKPEKGRYLHPTEHRALTHLEASRLQGFSDDYQWIGTKTSIARQIGNAVPIALAAALGGLVADRI